MLTPKIFNLEITADERFMLLVALSTTIAGGLHVNAPPIKEFETLARRLIDLSCQPSSSIQSAAPETTSPTVAPTRAPAPDAHTRGKDAGAGARVSSQPHTPPFLHLPKTSDELLKAGYTLHSGPPAFCRGCGQPIEWWETPNGKKMPMNVGVDHVRTSHFATCPKADEFRK